MNLSIKFSQILLWVHWHIFKIFHIKKKKILGQALWHSGQALWHSGLSDSSRHLHSRLTFWFGSWLLCTSEQASWSYSSRSWLVLGFLSSTWDTWTRFFLLPWAWPSPGYCGHSWHEPIDIFVSISLTEREGVKEGDTIFQMK